MPEEAETIHFVANRGDARLRLDQVLVRRLVEISRFSRTVAQRWIEAGAVTVDAARASRPAARVREGAAVEVRVPATATRRIRPAGESARLDVLYEDDALMIVNKPAGVVVHPSYKRPSGTLLNAVLWHVRDRPEARPGILTRLDRDTSGLVIVALSASAHASMQRDAAAGRVRKEYLAVVVGVPHPPTGTIDLRLARDPDDRRRVIAAPGGAPSETRYEVIATYGSAATSLVRCELVTGRTHQIRVHLSTKGWPIVGDRVYGAPHEAIARQALHAWRVSLLHPVTRDAIAIEAPMSADMQNLLAERTK